MYITWSEEALMNSGLEYNKVEREDGNYYEVTMTDVNTGQKFPLPARHSLGVVDVDMEKRRITINNPWDTFNQTYTIPLDFVIQNMAMFKYIDNPEEISKIQKMQITTTNTFNIRFMSPQEIWDFIKFW
jgi:hypothetical protein